MFCLQLYKILVRILQVFISGIVKALSWHFTCVSYFIGLIFSFPSMAAAAAAAAMAARSNGTGNGVGTASINSGLVIFTIYKIKYCNLKNGQ